MGGDSRPQKYIKLKALPLAGYFHLTSDFLFFLSQFCNTISLISILNYQIVHWIDWESYGWDFLFFFPLIIWALLPISLYKPSFPSELRRRVGGWNTCVFALSLYPVGQAPHNEFIASVSSTTFRLYRNCLKIDKLIISKEIHLCLKMNFCNHWLPW